MQTAGEDGVRGKWDINAGDANGRRGWNVGIWKGSSGKLDGFGESVRETGDTQGVWRLFYSDQGDQKGSRLFVAHTRVISVFQIHHVSNVWFN